MNVCVFGAYRLDEEYLDALKSLRERIVKLRSEKATLLSMLDDLEADAESEVDTLEAEIAVLESKILVKKKMPKQEITFNF